MIVRRKEVLFDFKDGGAFVEVTLIEVEIAGRVFCWAAGNEQDDNETIRWLEEHGREL